MGRFPHALVVVGHQDAQAVQLGVRLETGAGQPGGARHQVCTHFLDALLDEAGPREDVLELVGHLRLDADPAVQDRRGRRQDLVHRQRHLAADCLDRLGGRRALLRGQQLQGVQGGGQLAAENLAKL